MISPRVPMFLRCFLAVAAMVLVAAACGSGGADTVASNSTEPGTDTQDDSDNDASDTDADDSDAGDSGADADADAADAAGDEGEPGDTDGTDAVESGEADGDADTAPDPEPVTRDEVISNLVGNLTGHTITPDELACVDSEADSNGALGSMLDALAASLEADVDDAGFAEFAYALNGCIEPAVLADWAAVGMGLSDETITDDVSSCFDARFASGADEGDDNFYGLAARAVGFTVEQEATQLETVATLTECVPLTYLTEQLVNQSEAGSQFTMQVDRECAAAGLGADGVTNGFWMSVITNSIEGYAAIDEVIQECSEEYDSGLLKELPVDFEPWAGTGALAAVDPIVRNSVYSDVPPMVIDTSKNYEAVLATNGGEIRLKLFPETAPITVNNFVSLARDGYYDGTIFHRVLADFMAQAGDPTGTGTGGPGYQFGDEVDDGPPLDKRGLLAMANAGPGTNGSQFFITFAPTDWLTGNHTVFGELIEGDDILAAIDLRDPAAPTSRGQVIDSITIIES